ncbi:MULTISPECIES: DUF4255 domain-containing protein [Desulfobacula]|uniref:Conserved uncharacterized protein n=2 Tax=Desulfobacula TaxID=28222 RepID=K0N9X0_DESTT|nr:MULTISPECIES: DUF4255 domain-containing protein [Desulfobacula]CCK80804.1 conserved uncharacterized protein [Desulfobacula toluolica Tol2]SDU58214.1 Protein of unknown function [Desulfobacula phenolica]
MIHSAVSHITLELNQYLGRTFSLNEDIALMSNITEQDGSVAVNANNKIAVFIVNIEKDVTPSHLRSNGFTDAREQIIVYPPLHLNLFLMFAANFGGPNYPEALKFLSHTIRFFQNNPVFTRQNSPDLDPRIDKMILNIENLDMKDLSSLWNIISGKYLPSVLYRVKMLTFESEDVKAKVWSASDPTTSVNTL